MSDYYGYAYIPSEGYKIVNAECGSCARYHTKKTKWAKCKGKKTSTPCMAHASMKYYKEKIKK